MPETGNNIVSQDISIRISTDGFSFFANGKRKAVSFDKKDTNYYRSMAICLCENDLQQQNAHFDIYIDTACFSLVPQAVFKDEHAETFLKFSHNLKSDVENNIISTPIAGHDIVNIFAVEKELTDFIKRNFSNYNIQHAQTPFIRQALRDSKKDFDTDQTWINLDKSSAYILLCKGGRLLFANRFELKSETDLIFYLGSIFERYNLSQQTCPVYVCGNESCLPKLRKHLQKITAVSLLS